jgi:hypothetical protein
MRKLYLLVVAAYAYFANACMASELRRKADTDLLDNIAGVLVMSKCAESLLNVRKDSDDTYDNIDVDLNHLSDETKREIIAMRARKTEEERFRLNRSDWIAFCQKGYARNSYDTDPLRMQLIRDIGEDPKAGEALNLFLESSKFWEFIDYCVDNISSMSGVNQQRYKDILILLAPGMISTRYKKKIVLLIAKDQRDMTIHDVQQHIPFCLDMFFYVAVKNAQFGRVAMADMCMDAFYAPCINCDSSGYHDERFTSRNIYPTVYRNGARRSEFSRIGYCIKSIWPNWIQKDT